ncbi:hypothetical protein L1887_56648 [Cichorium endivia]|nr:hypothetical protein L1887_56648 [Cichorium endivia]
MRQRPCESLPLAIEETISSCSKIAVEEMGRGGVWAAVPNPGCRCCQLVVVSGCDTATLVPFDALLVLADLMASYCVPALDDLATDRRLACEIYAISNLRTRPRFARKVLVLSVSSSQDHVIHPDFVILKQVVWCGVGGMIRVVRRKS